MAPQFLAADADTLSKFLNELDEGFGAIIEPEAPSAPSDRAAGGASPRTENGASAAKPDQTAKRPLLTDSASLADVRQLFAELAQNHMRHVRDLMIGMRWGETRGNSLEGCEPAIVSLARAAKEMELAALVDALDAFAVALREAATRGAVLDDGTRASLFERYGKLVELMPQAFALDGEQNRREAAIIHALLEQVPDVRKTTIDKLHAAGLSSLDVLFLAKADEIVQTTGIAGELAARIVEKFQSYRRDMISGSIEGTRGDRERLRAALAELAGLHAEFESLADAWSDEAAERKRNLRQARADTFLKIKVVLARMGEVDRLSQIEKLPFESKIARLDDYMKEGGRAHASL